MNQTGCCRWYNNQLLATFSNLFFSLLMFVFLEGQWDVSSGYKGLTFSPVWLLSIQLRLRWLMFSRAYWLTPPGSKHFPVCPSWYCGMFCISLDVKCEVCCISLIWSLPPPVVTSVMAHQSQLGQFHLLSLKVSRERYCGTHLNLGRESYCVTMLHIPTLIRSATVVTVSTFATWYIHSDHWSVWSSW